MRSMELPGAGLLKQNLRSKSFNLQRRPKDFAEVLPPHDELRYAEPIAPRQDEILYMGRVNWRIDLLIAFRLAWRSADELHGHYFDISLPTSIPVPNRAKHPPRSDLAFFSRDRSFPENRRHRNH